MSGENRVRDVIAGLFQSQRTAFLSTQQEGKPYANIVAFVADTDMKWMLFATERATHKFENISRCPHVALLITNAINREDDFVNAAAVTVTGRAGEITGSEKQALIDSYVSRHPTLAKFVRSPGCALIRVEIAACVLVERFRDVSVLQITTP